MAQTAERGKFDLIFFADALAIRDGDLKAKGRWPQYIAYFEPMTLLSAMSVVTERVGLVSTASTSYSEPFNLARWFASLDHLSGGRAGWNVVTTGNAASSLNFGREEHFAHDERYDRADEFVEVVRGLWDSWDDDAFVMDRENGRYFDPDKMHWLNHKGTILLGQGPAPYAPAAAGTSGAVPGRHVRCRQGSRRRASPTSFSFSSKSPREIRRDPPGYQGALPQNTAARRTIFCSCPAWR